MTRELNEDVSLQLMHKSNVINEFGTDDPDILELYISNAHNAKDHPLGFRANNGQSTEQYLQQLMVGDVKKNKLNAAYTLRFKLGEIECTLTSDALALEKTQKLKINGEVVGEA
ncbi:MAG: hypothetical protein M3R00_04825, partial [Pseudomonadota bacterium]|nr:hypothetical protein [Pseudomonadota bacterium]